MKHSGILILCTVILLPVYVMFDIYRYAQQSTNHHADAAIILGAAVWENSPSPVFEERIKHGLTLFQSQKIKTLIFTGGIGDNDTVSEAEVAKQYAIDQGIPESAILTETHSTLTIDNLRFTLPLMTENNIATVILVSDPLHMKRAMSMAKDLGIKAFNSPTPTSRIQSFTAQSKMLFSEMYFYLKYQLSL